MDLNGTWKLRWTDGQRGKMEYANGEEMDPVRYLDAQVPGEVHLDLWRQGLIADPYVGLNCLSARWVEECIWSYRKEFDAPDEALQGRAWLVFEGLDLAATIVLNGQEVGRHKNAFYPCRLDVSGKLRAGRNILAVHLDGGLYEVADKPVAGWHNALDTRLHKRHWLRKPQCQFSWDWSTRLINVGIFKPVRLEWAGMTGAAARVRVDQLVPLVELSSDLKNGTVLARLFIEGLTDRSVQGKLTVELLETGRQVTGEVEIRPGLHPSELSLQVPSPKLWWPVGHGEQSLYTLRVTLAVDDQVVGQKTAMVGFRYVKVNQDVHPESGRYFVFEINGKPIFCKGGNFVPADMIFARLDRRRYDQLTDLALEANFNFLRVWGGGLYESDDFYEWCDRKGILVWQEFIFACAKYPITDQAFFDDVKIEAIYNIRRLASHPSLIAWCGNNEMEQAAWDWGYDRGVVYPDYSFFHLTLPRLMAQEDPTRYYQPSSPFSPDHQKPTLDDVGDQHPWSLGFTNNDFREYRKMICRFPNEGGILGPTALPTMLACLPPGQQAVQSFAWQVHDNSMASTGQPCFPDQMIQQWLGRDPLKMSIEEFTYRAGIVHGEGLREYCDNFRRRMFSSSSAIFWMYNDCWPATRSWTIVDYYLRRTPAFHFVRRAMAPLHVVVAQEGSRIIVFGINETPTTVNAELRYGIFNLAGGDLPMDRSVKVALPPNRSTELASFALKEWIDPHRSAAFAQLSDDGKLLARNRLFLPLFRELKWASAEPRISVREGQAIFESSIFAWSVCLDLTGEIPLSDNFFDLYPGVPYAIPWSAPQPPRILWVGNL